MELGISGRLALVCGGGRGIGRACALKLAEEGADVAVLSRTPDEVANVAAAVAGLGRRSLGLCADLGDPRSLDEALAQLSSTLGSPTLLVLAASAMWQPRKLQFASDEEVRAQLGTDLLSGLAVCQRLLPGMVAAGFGRVVALTSLASRFGISGGTEYAVAKAGLEAMVRGIALDYARKNITANAVSPGFVLTERLETRAPEGSEQREKLVRATPRKRLIAPQEVADVVAFLCSERASAVTGTVVEVTAAAHLNSVL